MQNKFIILLFLICYTCIGYCSIIEDNPDLIYLPQADSLINLEEKHHLEDVKRTLVLYNRILNSGHKDSITLFKRSSLLHAELGHSSEAIKHVEKYIKNTADFEVLHNESFDQISNAPQFKELKSQYLTKVTLLDCFYIFVAFIGFYITATLNLSKKSDRMANLLISLFVAIHALFITEFVLYSTNIQLQYPHTYAMASFVTLLYGPLLYFYFKRITQGYRFRKVDLLHLVPTVLVIIYLLPIYNLPSEEKIKIMMGESLEYKNYTFLIFFPKLASLFIYGYFTFRVHLKYLNEDHLNLDLTRLNWEKNMYKIHVVYLVSYFVYGISISGVFGDFPSYIYNAQVVAMSAMVVYVAYMASTQPAIFSGLAKLEEDINPELIKIKYEKSGLTNTLSEELKENLIKLLVRDKIYKRNDISLEILSQELNTTRHNTSQIINEHFNINFFELINKFRIQEAVTMFEKDTYGNLNIIEVAYEVGYNNKVTFNKAFKKELELTPTQYLQEIKRFHTSKRAVNFNRQGKLL